jgi:hypothetical protein
MIFIGANLGFFLDAFMRADLDFFDAENPSPNHHLS